MEELDKILDNLLHLPRTPQWCKKHFPQHTFLDTEKYEGTRKIIYVRRSSQRES
jgi:hypothetical protein